MLRLWVLSVVLPCAAQSSPSPTPAQALIVTSPLDNVYVYDDESQYYRKMYRSNYLLLEYYRHLIVFASFCHPSESELDYFIRRS